MCLRGWRHDDGGIRTGSVFIKRKHGIKKWYTTFYELVIVALWESCAYSMGCSTYSWTSAQSLSLVKPRVYVIPTLSSLAAPGVTGAASDEKLASWRLSLFQWMMPVNLPADEPLRHVGGCHSMKVSHRTLCMQLRARSSHKHSCTNCTGSSGLWWSKPAVRLWKTTTNMVTSTSDEWRNFSQNDDVFISV